MELNQFFSSPGVARSLLTDSFLQELLTGKKLPVWVLEAWDQLQKMPVNGGILIYVPHLGSSTQPWWATRRTTTRTSWGTSTAHTLVIFCNIFKLHMIPNNVLRWFPWKKCVKNVSYAWPVEVPYDVLVVLHLVAHQGCVLDPKCGWDGLTIESPENISNKIRKIY